MIHRLQNIAEVFVKVARNENNQLAELCGEGIFFMPELAYAYACGKAIMAEKNRIFGEMDVTWVRELDLGNGGPSDLVFLLPGDKSIVVEFKVGATIDSYKLDIQKLARLDGASHARVFCALVDAFTEKKPDKRLDNIEQSLAVNFPAPLSVQPLLMTPFPSFKTKDGKVSCVVQAWLLGEAPCPVP